MVGDVEFGAIERSLPHSGVRLAEWRGRFGTFPIDEERRPIGLVVFCGLVRAPAAGAHSQVHDATGEAWTIGLFLDRLSEDGVSFRLPVLLPYILQPIVDDGRFGPVAELRKEDAGNPRDRREVGDVSSGDHI